MVINKDLRLDDNEDGRDALGPDLRSGQLAQGLVGNVCQQLAADLLPSTPLSPGNNLAVFRIAFGEHSKVICGKCEIRKNKQSQIFVYNIFQNNLPWSCPKM